MGLFDRLRSDGDPRVVFLGIDGVPYSLVADNPDVFPNLTEIAETGVGGSIDSIVPPESSACWPALTTGRNPGGTGVYGFHDREIDSYDPYLVNRTNVRADRVWDRVEAEGRSATVMNVPVTYPPQRNVQRMVSGFLSPGLDKAAYPDELRDYLDRVDYRIDVDANLGHEDDRTAFFENAHETLDRRHEAFDHYVEADDWDLFFGVFMATDRVNHFAFRDYEDGGACRDDFLDFYRRVDEHVGSIWRSLPDDVTTVVASDHGFTSLEYEVNCNKWLQEQGWITYETEAHEELDDIAAESRAYSFIPGRFYVNLEGREPRGGVPEDEYEETVAELKRMLQSLEGPDGRPVADRVVEGTEVFRGDHEDIAPDVVVVPNDGFDLKSSFDRKDQVFDAAGARNGMHTFHDATLVADDPEVGIDGDVDLLDITPTLLDAMEIDYPRASVDGGSLVGARH